MNKDHAKEILLRYQPGRDNTVDPEIVEALRLVDEDPELALWFEQQQRADKAIRARLRETPVPDDLKDRILAERKIVRPDFSRWRTALTAAAAALVVLGLLAEWMWMGSPGANGGFSDYRKEMVAYVANGYQMYIKANNFDELRQVLAQRQWPADFVVPDRLRTVTVIGGSAIQWKQSKVSLACMKEDNHGVWLFVIDEPAVRGAPSAETPRVQMVDAMPTASWSQNGKTYLLTVQGDEAFLRKYLP